MARASDHLDGLDHLERRVFTTLSEDVLPFSSLQSCSSFSFCLHFSVWQL